MMLTNRSPPKTTIWLQQLGCLAHNNAQMTVWKHQILMLETHQSNRLNSCNPQINSILHQDIVTRLRSHHFQALPSSTTMPDSIWHPAHNRALVQPKDIWVIGHCGKHMISPTRLWWTSNVPPSAIHRTWAIISRHPPSLPRHNPVIRLTSSFSTAPGQLPGAPGSTPISLPMKRFQPAAEPRRTDVEGIADLPSLLEMSHDKYDAD